MKELQSGTAKLKEDFDPFFDDPTSLFNVQHAESVREMEREREEEEVMSDENFDDSFQLTSKCHNEEPEESDFMIATRHKRIVRQLSDCSLVQIARVMDVILCHMTTDELCNLRDVNQRTIHAILTTPRLHGEQLTSDARSLIQENKVIGNLISDVLLRRAGG